MAMQQRKRRRRSGGNPIQGPAPSNPNKHFESNGPDVRIRGSAAQILEKYIQYARDAQTAGDRVKAEALFQHAEHYARIVAEFDKEQERIRLDREFREQQKADERAQREAEERAERQARQADERVEHRGDARVAEPVANDTFEDSKVDSQLETSGDLAVEGSDDVRRNRRRPRRQSEDNLAVIDADDTDSEEPASIELSDGSSEDRPRRRRRSYSPREESVEEGGVLKTISRGMQPISVDGDA